MKYRKVYIDYVQKNLIKYIGAEYLVSVLKYTIDVCKFSLINKSSKLFLSLRPSNWKNCQGKGNACNEDSKSMEKVSSSQKNERPLSQTFINPSNHDSQISPQTKKNPSSEKSPKSLSLVL